MPVGRLCKRIDLHKIAGILRVDPDGPRCVDVGDLDAVPVIPAGGIPDETYAETAFFGRAVRELAGDQSSVYIIDILDEDGAEWKVNKRVICGERDRRSDDGRRLPIALGAGDKIDAQ